MTKLKWAIDPTHSEIGFRIKHMMFTTISGKFTRFEAAMETDGENFGAASFDFETPVSSISTGNTDRDTHLQSADFFDAAQYPTIQFKSQKLEKKNGRVYELTGNLTMHGVTNPIELQCEMSELLTDPWGRKKLAFAFSGKLKRKDWNLEYNAVLEAGGVLIGDEVAMAIELQFVSS